MCTHTQTHPSILHMKVINAMAKMETGGRRVNTSQKGAILNSVARKSYYEKVLAFFFSFRAFIIIYYFTVISCFAFVLRFEGGKEVIHPGIEEKHA